MDDTEQSRSEFQELTDAVQGHPGRDVEHLLHMIEITHSVFRGNSEELIADLRSYEDPQIAAGLWPKPLGAWDFKDLDAFVFDVTRRLHNYVASARTLVEHTRTWIRRSYEGTEFWEEYEAAKDRAFADPLARFIQDLRNYALHEGLPIPKAKAPPGSVLHLEVAKLKKWDGWKSQARKFLDESGDELVLLTAVEEYTEKVTAFQAWIRGRVRDWHRADLEDFASTKQRLSDYYARQRRAP